MLSAAGACRVTDSTSLQALWRLSGPTADQANCHGKEGVAGSSPAEGFTNRAAARFSCSWSGSGDLFLDAQGVAARARGGAGATRSAGLTRLARFLTRRARRRRPGPGTQWVQLIRVRAASESACVARLPW
jgi:hypothetical protein